MIYQVPLGEAVTMTPEILSKLHKIQLETLLEIDRICKKNDIQYWLHAGTLLGAVRHEGFIPWDDDLDIQMFREEYDRFCEICPQELDHERFFWQTAETDPGYRWTYGKMRRKGTQYVRSGQEHMTAATGVFVDIIPFDGRPENPFMDWLQYYACKYARRVLWSPVGAVWEQNRVKRRFYQILSRIPKNLVYRIYTYFATLRSPRDSKYVIRYCLDLENRPARCLKAWYQDTVDVRFEGCTFPAPIGTPELLTYYYYGNYMELPPMEDRHGNAPASLIELPDEV